MKNSVFSLKRLMQPLKVVAVPFQVSFDQAVPSDSRQKRLSLFLEIALVAGLVVYAFGTLSKCLTVSWLYTSDEVVYAAEVIKFLDLNFQQNFFDIPGTPFMLITTILWALWGGIQYLTGNINSTTSLHLYTFQHLDQLYFLMRLLVLIFYALSIILVYLCGKRLTNAVGGCVAALLLAFFTPYTTYSTLVRTESMGICLTLIAFYLVLNAQKTASSSFKPYLLAGLSSGVATASRYHFVFATLLQLFTLFFVQPNPSRQGDVRQQLPRWAMVLAVSIATVLIFGGILTLLLSLKLIPENALTHLFLISPDDPSLTKAISIIRKLWLLMAGVAIALLVAFRFPQSRAWAKIIVQPALLLLITGFGVGLVLGTPTFLWRGRYLLTSIQFYSNWIDYDRLKLSPLAQYWDLYTSYWEIVASSPALGILLALGTLLVILRRDRWFYPVLLGAVFAFVAQPVLLPVSQHRPLPWLPYIALVQAYPFAVLYQAFLKFTRQQFWLSPIALLVLFWVGFISSQNGVAKAVESSDLYVVPRLMLVERASKWLDANAEADTHIFMAYGAFNEQVYYSWMQSLGTRIPKEFQSRRTYHIWWSNRSPLENRSGYIVTSRGQLEFFKLELQNQNPKEVVDPFTDQRFQEVAQFTEGGQDLTIFRFSLEPQKQKSPPK